MASSRHPPAPPNGSPVGPPGQGPAPDPEPIQVPGPGQVAGLRRTKAGYGPPALPPPLRPIGPAQPGPPLRRAFGDDEVDEKTTVDPQAPKNLRELIPDPVTEGPDDPDQKSTTMTEAMTSDNAPDILVQPMPADLSPRPRSRLHRPSETEASRDDSTDDQSAGHTVPPPIALARVPRAPGSLTPPSPAAPEPPLAPASSASGPQAGPNLPAPSGAWLVVHAGADQGRRFALKAGRTSIGRGVDNDVVLTDIAVSRRHLAIDFDGSTYVMRDLGSGNGTLVNHRDEDDAFRLGHGDKMELGNTVLLFENTVAAPQHPPGKWPDDDELSTVAGRRAGISGEQPFPRAASPVPVPPQALRPQSGQLPGPPPLVSTMPGPPPRPRPYATPSDPAGTASLRSPSNGSGRGTLPPGPHAPHHDVGRAGVSTHPPMPASAAAFASFPSGLPPGHISAAPRSAAPFPASQGGYSMSPNPVSAAQFQYPNGVMAPLPAPERRRVLIGILGVAFVAVGAGIIMALVYGGTSSQRRKPQATQPAVAGAPASIPAVPGTSPVPPTAGTTPPTGGTTPSMTAPVAAPAQDLYGSRDLQPTDFGTDESTETGAASAESSQSARDDRDDQDRSGRDSGRDRGDRGDDRAETTRRDQTDRRDETAERVVRRKSRPRLEIEPRVEPIDDRDNQRAMETVDDTRGGDSSGAVRQAESLYRQQRFADAAAALRRAADSGGRKDGGRLRDLADRYTKIGRLLTDGKENQVSDAPRALQAYRDALRLDEEYGDSVHDRAIGARIAQVAPAAAGAYMARREFAEAKAAADSAEKFGAGDSDRIRSVRASLERKAQQLYQEAVRAAQSGDNATAAEKARLIRRMVPRSSAVYGQAAKLAGG